MEGRLPEPMKVEGNLSENFNKFYQNFETYLIATEKDSKSDKVKIALFLNLIGTEGVEIYNILKIPEKDKFKSVLDEFRKYCAPRKNKIYERFVFNNRNQESEEPFDHFFGELKKLIQSCEYDTQEDSILIDRIVLGVNDPNVQEKLLSIQNLTIDRAINICRNAELTKNQLKSVRNMDNAGASGVDAVRMRKSNQKLKKFSCRKCKGTHGFAECPAFGKTCYKCGKENHFSSACRERKTENKHETFVKKVKEIIEKDKDSDGSVENEDLFVHCLKEVGEVKNKNRTVWMEKLKVHNTNIHFKVDTGSEVNILPKKVLKEICRDHGSHKIEQCNTILEAYGGARLKPVGKVNLQCIRSHWEGGMDLPTTSYHESPTRKYYCEHCDGKRSLKNHVLARHDKNTIKNYSCNHCDNRTHKNEHLSRHVLAKHNKNLVKHDDNTIKKHHCNECDYRTNIKQNLNRHILTKHDKDAFKKYGCTYCDYRTHFKQPLIKHVIAKHNENLVEHDKNTIKKHHCNECDYRTNRKDLLNFHLLTKHDKKHHCNECDYSTNRKDLLNLHVCTKHDKNTIKKFSCNYCSYITHRRKKLNFHIKGSHDKNPIKKHCCNYCDYKSHYKAYLHAHLLAIHDENTIKQYSCNYCDYRTQRTSNLSLHIKARHEKNSIKKHSCDHCDYKSHRKSHLNAHVLSKHDKNTIEKYKCNNCDYKTHYKQNLIKYVLAKHITNVIKKYCCYNCDYKTDNRTHMFTHLYKLYSKAGSTVCRIQRNDGANQEIH